MPAATVPELVLKKRRTSEAITARRVNHLKKVAAKRRVSRKAAFKNAEKYTKEYRSKSASSCPPPPGQARRQLLRRGRAQGCSGDPHPRYQRHGPADPQDPAA